MIKERCKLHALDSTPNIENEKHIAEAFKHIVINKLEIDKINLYFTTDLKQNSDTLEDTLVSIKLDPDTQKYQMVTEKIKLLS